MPSHMQKTLADSGLRDFCEGHILKLQSATRSHMRAKCAHKHTRKYTNAHLDMAYHDPPCTNGTQQILSRTPGTMISYVKAHTYHERCCVWHVGGYYRLVAVISLSLRQKLPQTCDALKRMSATPARRRRFSLFCESHIHH